MSFRKFPTPKCSDSPEKLLRVYGDVLLSVAPLPARPLPSLPEVHANVLFELGRGAGGGESFQTIMGI